MVTESKAMMTKMKLKKILYDPLPPSLKAKARATKKLAGFVPFTRAWERRRFLKQVYMPHIRSEHHYIFASITRFCTTNRPINGYYLEFGCHSATTMRMAHSYFKHLFDWTYVAFDSFEGLPDIEQIDRQEIWEKGKLSTSEDQFRKLVVGAGMPGDKLITIKGFYDKSLNDALHHRLSGKRAAVIYIDCDLYASAVPVLEFVKNFLQVGTIIVFDDWNCFCADPEKGERRAFADFRTKYPELRFEEFISTHMQKAFVYVGFSAG